MGMGAKEALEDIIMFLDPRVLLVEATVISSFGLLWSNLGAGFAANSGGFFFLAGVFFCRNQFKKSEVRIAGLVFTAIVSALMTAVLR